jgi:hypothetical protein
MVLAVVGCAVGIAPEEASTSLLLSASLACAVVTVVYQAYAGAALSSLFANAAGAAPSYQLLLLLKSPWLIMRAVDTRLRSLSS